MRGHVGTETLAEFREDLLPRRAAERVAAHLRECAQCARLDAQLASVSATLAQSRVPPMPDALTERITAALAAEAARAGPGRTAAPLPGLASERSKAKRARREGDGYKRPGGPRQQSAPGAQRSSAPRRRAGLALRAATAVAAAVVLAGAGYGIARLLPSGQPGTASSGSPAEGAGSVHAPSAARPGSSSGLKAPNEGPAPEVLANVVHSGTNYQPGRLAAQVATVLARPRPSRSHSGSAAVSSPAISFGKFRDLPACVRALTGGSPPRLVDVATFRGQPAAVIVTGLATARELRVWVVGTGCSGSTRDLLARTMVANAP